MTLQLLLCYLVALSLPVLLVVEEVRRRRRLRPVLPSRSPVRHPNEERHTPAEPVELKAS
jgi:hypothetical protein